MRHCAALIFAVLSTACTVKESDLQTYNIPEIDWSSAEVDETNPEDRYYTMDISGEMKGRFRGVGDFDDTAAYGWAQKELFTDSSGTEESLFVQLHTLSGDGWAMIGVYLDIDPATGTGSNTNYDFPGLGGTEELVADLFEAAPPEASLRVDEDVIDGENVVVFEIRANFRGNNEVVATAILPAAE